MRDRPLIAIINDDPAFLEFLASFLEEETSYQTIVLDDGLESLPTLREHKPDAVILDVRLGDQPVGEDILKAMRDDPELCGVPVILCTADTIFLRDHQELIDSLGADALEKPFDLDVLEQKVAAAVGERSPVVGDADLVV